MKGHNTLVPIGAAVGRDMNSGGSRVTGFSCNAPTGSAGGHVSRASRMKPAFQCSEEVLLQSMGLVPMTLSSGSSLVHRLGLCPHPRVVDDLLSATTDGAARDQLVA